MKYIVAVSGGIDSVVLLDILVGSGQDELVVAHVDHGIRENSSDDAELTRRLARDYNLPYESCTLRLGKDASELEARDARYAFLRAMSQRHGADAIATAHHQDDVIETMIINIIRGTGWRGLVSLGEGDEVIRPLLSWSKSRIISYAIDHGLDWHEDSTNDDVTYLRNAVRYRVVQRLTANERGLWIRLYRDQLVIKDSIETELDEFGPDLARSRYWLIMSGREVAGEVLTRAYGRMERTTLDQLWHFICVGRPGKQFIQGGRRYELTTRELIVSAL